MPRKLVKEGYLCCKLCKRHVPASMMEDHWDAQHTAERAEIVQLLDLEYQPKLEMVGAL